MKRAFKNLKSKLEATVEDTFSLQFPGTQSQSKYQPQHPFQYDGELPPTMTSVDDDPRIFPVKQEDMMLYRKHRGVNLGSWFVLERWITESPYREAAGPGQSDLDVAKGRNAKAILEKHWDTWITEKDWSWIAGVGINAVRIPIGYYHVCGADRSILDGTDFYPFYNVYEGAWKRITNAILEANKRNISVMLDLHAAPGKQNADAHSGTSNSPNFFNDPHNQQRTLYALTSLTTHLVSFLNSQPLPPTNIIGIQLLNEPAPPNDTILQSFYTSTILQLQKIAPSIPIYLGEVWRPDAYADYVARDLAPKLSSDNENAMMIVLDHHLYRCFTPSDTNTPVAQHTHAIRTGETPAMLDRISEKMGRLGGGLVVAEWSGGLHPNSLASTTPASKQLEARREFVQAQMEVYDRSTCGGWYFWCYKKEYAGDVGWSFKEAMEKGIFSGKFGMVAKKRYTDFEVEAERRGKALVEARNAMYNRHVQYWSQFPNQTYEHARFISGFDAGWNANYRYFDSLNPDDPKVSEIGQSRNSCLPTIPPLFLFS
ncbi:cytoplasmic protein [Coprinopsis sp. MPI-PUGE-AT-0042]|nr:cytoplasmic protein [Coprinopsis sp. MPI-PUGE-AT-0042]